MDAPNTPEVSSHEPDVALDSTFTRLGSDTDAAPRAVVGDVLWLRLLTVLSILLALSGGVLLFVYQPSAGAERSLTELREVGRFGALRDVHHWASQALLIVGFLAITRAFVLGEDRDRRRWSAAVGLFVAIILAAASGWLLSRPGLASLAVYVAHVWALPLILVGLAFWSRRSATSERAR